MKFNKILITGGTGEIGSLLVEKLAEGNNLIVLGRNRRKSNIIYKKIKEEKIDFIKSDITKAKDIAMFKDKLMEVDCLLHLAALVKDSKDVTCDAKQIIENNIFGTINILKVLPRLKHIFFSSTCSVYGKITKSDHRQVNEFHSTNPEGLYALSKLICEKLLKMYCEDNKIKLCILRISSVYSPFDYLRNSKRAIQIFAENIKGGKDIVIFGNGQNKRDYIFLEDAVDGIIWSMNTLREGIYNISSGKAVSINKIAKMLLGISGKDINIFHEKNSSQDDVCCYSSKKALNEGFLLKYNLRSGLKRVYESTG